MGKPPTLRHYRLRNTGEAKPTRMVGTPLGKSVNLDADPRNADWPKGGTRTEPFDPTVKRLPKHRGFLAVYDRTAENAADQAIAFGVDVQRVTRSWAYVRVLRSTTSSAPPINAERRINPMALRAPTSGELFWWAWPNRDDYDYDGKLEAALAAAGVVKP